MLGAAYLTMAALHATIWAQRRGSWGSLFFSTATAATAAYAACELWMMRAGTPAEYATALRWLHVPAFILIASLVGFIRFYLHAGSAGLGWSVVVLRGVSLLCNFFTGENLNYSLITRLDHVRLLGEDVAVAEGVRNPWMLVGQLSMWLAFVFLADASLSLWRRGQRLLALSIGGSAMFFAAAATLHSAMALGTNRDIPLMNSLYYLPLVVAMGYEIAKNVLRSLNLADELRLSEERFELATTAAGVSVWMWNLANNEVWVSGDRRRLREIGIERQEILSIDSVLAFVHPGDRQQVESILRRVAHEGGDYSVETRILEPDGSARWISSQGRMFAATESSPARLLGAVTNITARKVAELQLERQRNELAHLSRVTTLSILSTSIAHELNQPLAIILSNAQAAQTLLAREPPPVYDLQEILSDIVTADRRAAEIIVRLRALLKPGETVLRNVSLNDVVETVLKLVRADLMARGVEVSCQLETPLADVCGDAVQLQQLVLNLVLNGADAMTGNAAKERRMQVTTERADGAVRVSVRDEGSGLPADTAKIFEPFFTTKAAGLGMGLSICSSIVSAHRGRLWAQPAPRRGAVFQFELPVAAPGENP